MSLNKEFLERKSNIVAKVVADSVSKKGKRITTFEIEYPRFIHSELMTHRMLSKNSSSSRAIPIAKMLEQIEDNMATPLYWGKAKSGMQATEEVLEFEKVKSKANWKRAFNYTKERVSNMSKDGLHKQVPNRLLEPFQMMKVVITGTEWDNFFNLRIHPDAQPEICKLAYEMYKAMQDSKPYNLKSGEWHLPYVNIGWSICGEIAYTDESFNVITLDEAIKLSAASCAAVSYRTECMTLEKAEKIFDMLIKAEVVHSSPFEHLATPIVEVWDKTGDTFDVFINKEKSKNVVRFMETWEDGITHVNKQGELCSGNLVGWIQYRHLLPSNTCWKFDFEERMNTFDK